MESKGRTPLPPEGGELAVGAQVALYMNGKRMEKQILERGRGKLLLGALGPDSEKPLYFQPACVAQTLADERILFLLLRYEGGTGKGLSRKDMFHESPGGPLYIWPELHRLAMHHWLAVRVFDIYQPERVVLEDQGFLYALSETEASIIMSKPIVQGAFAECSLPLPELKEPVKVVLTRCEDLDDGAGYRAHFTVIDPSMRPRLREFMLTERARRLQAANAR